MRVAKSAWNLTFYPVTSSVNHLRDEGATL